MAPKIAVCELVVRCRRSRPGIAFILAPLLPGIHISRHLPSEDDH